MARKLLLACVALFVVAAGVFVGWKAGESLDAPELARVSFETETLIERVSEPQPTLAPPKPEPLPCCGCCELCGCDACCCEEELPPPIEPIELEHPTPVVAKPPIRADPVKRPIVKPTPKRLCTRRRFVCRRRFLFRRRCFR